MVAVDTVTSDVIVTDPAATAPYDQLYARLAAAALDPAQSLDLITTHATELPRRLTPSRLFHAAA